LRAVAGERTDWKFLTNHGMALICIARDPGIRLRDIADKVGITERSAHRIVSELVQSGYVGRERDGRRNSYEVRTDLPVSLALERDLQLGDLLGAVFTTREPVTAEN
jgi:predicted transcriptional regulator